MDNLRNGILVIYGNQMVFELVKEQASRLASNIEMSHDMVPTGCNCSLLLQLCIDDDFIVAGPPPEPLVVVDATGLVGLIRLHLGFTEILGISQPYVLEVIHRKCHLD